MSYPTPCLLRRTTRSSSRAPSRAVRSPELFVAAFEKVAAEKAKEPQATLPTAGTEAVTTHKSVAVENHRERATRFAIEHLYLMAETDEEAGEFDRADQWRAVARELRGTSACEAPEGLASPR
jgi:hypothetical protein